MANIKIPNLNGEKKIEELVQQPLEETLNRTVIMTELDSMIHERIKSQPIDVVDVKAGVSRAEAPGLHRLSLPDFFEEQSYDCTRGDSCAYHKKEKNRKSEDYGKVLNPGKYIFRWILKDKRAMDVALNVRGWYLANRSYFPKSPKNLFSASGAVELGDSLLTFMTVQKALNIRKFPSERSRDLLKSRMTVSKKNPTGVLMTNNPDDDRYYEPDLSKDESEQTPAGAMVEGRDF